MISSTKVVMTKSAVVHSTRQSSWGWEISCAVFLGGAGGATFLVSFIMAWAGDPDLARWGTIAGLGLVIACTFFLFVDLGNKTNVYRLYARAGSSWMSRGTWFITGFLASGAVYSVLSFWAGLSGPAVLGVGALACIFAFLVTLYTGLLFGVLRRIPMWNTPALPLLYDFSALASGMAILGLTDTFLVGSDGFVETAIPIQIAILLVELLILAAYIEIIRQSSEIGAKSIRLLLCPSFFIGVIGMGLIIPVGLLAYAEAGAQMTAVLACSNVLILIGNMLLRYFIVKAGVYPDLSPF